MLPAQRRPGLRQRWDPSPEARSPSVCEGWGRLCAAHQNQTVASRLVCGQFGASLKPLGPPLGSRLPCPGPASRTQATSFPPSTASPLPQGHRQTGCLPCSSTSSPPVSSTQGQLRARRDSVLFMALRPPARPGTGLGQQLALGKCLLSECAGPASLMHASS